jgi:hypothetical protein
MQPKHKNKVHFGCNLLSNFILKSIKQNLKIQIIVV